MNQPTDADISGRMVEWAVSSPEAGGLNSAPLEALTERIRSSKQANIHSVLIAHHGKLAYEQYFNGMDERWGEQLGRVAFGPSTLHDIRSVTKSITSLLFGVALELGFLPSVDEPILSYFKELDGTTTSAGKTQIQLRHLLTMSMGLEWDQYRPASDPMNSEIRMIQASDPYRFVLERPVNSKPGSRWTYSSGAAELLGEVVRRSTGSPFDEFAGRRLFEPLGISEYEWIKLPTNGAPSASSGLRLRPRDLAKIGQLVLSKGELFGKRIVSADWIAGSLTPQIAGPEIYFYGYQWMLGRSLIEGREIGWSVAMGMGGQRLFVVPELDLVVVITAGLYNSPLQYTLPLQILNQHVLASVTLTESRVAETTAAQGGRLYAFPARSPDTPPASSRSGV